MHPDGHAHDWIRTTFRVALASSASALIGAELAHARQTTEYVSLTTQGTLPTNGASGTPAAFGVSADGNTIAFHSFATDVVPGVTVSAQTYVRDRRRAKTLLASCSTAGVPGNGQSIPMDVSWNGRWVLFRSQSLNLDPADVTAYDDVFLRDLATSTTTIESLGTGGTQGNGAVGYHGQISADGRFVAFDSRASNWFAGDANNAYDVFVRDRATSITELVSATPAGGAGNGDSFACDMSPDGRYVAFASTSSDLVAGDTNGKRDIFLRDRTLGTTVLISVSTLGALGSPDSNLPEVSNDGRFVAFETGASLDPSDTNNYSDVYLRDVAAGTTTRVSLGLSLNQLNGSSFAPDISADGSYVSFATQASNHGFPNPNGHDDDIFVMHVPSMTLTRASVSWNGAPAIDACIGPRLSLDGRSVVFTSYDLTLAPIAAPNYYVDVFVHDMFASPIASYCTATSSGIGCVTTLSAQGVASSSAAAPFVVRARQVDNGQAGLFLYGFGAATIPIQAGLLCVAPPHARTLVQSSGGDPLAGTNCTGALSVDFNAVIQSGVHPQLTAGATVFCQAWYRDPQSAFHSALSSGLHFPILP